MMPSPRSKICTEVFIESPEVVRDQIEDIYFHILREFNFDPVKDIFQDTIRLFNGKFPGYRPSRTKYHDLEHTLAVTLATVRLLNGCAIGGHRFSSTDLFLAVTAALFHDTGLIQDQSDTRGTGAKYTIGHEARSIEFAATYLSDKGVAKVDIENCTAIIECTILSKPPQSVQFPTEECRILGNIVGSADLLAQIADRQYLEKLLLLYREFEEARLPGFDSELDLLKKTSDFYKNIARKRMMEDFGGVCEKMLLHFKAYCSMDIDVYEESIQKNIQYIEDLQKKCDDVYECYLKNLRRGGIAKEALSRYRSWQKYRSSTKRTSKN